MPRTKVQKNGLMKRNRRNSLDEKLSEFIREYEIEGKFCKFFNLPDKI